METIKFALLGCGKIGERHAKLMHEKGKLIAVCDIEKEKADALAHQVQSKSYYSLEKLLQQEKQIDVIAVCTPNGLHAKHSISILNAGVHVLCEKPMALTTGDCSEMIRTAEKNNKRLFVVKQNRFNPPIKAVKQLIEEGRLGKIYSVQLNCFWNRDEEYYRDTWRGSLLMDGGTLFTQFSHFIDLLYWMIGDVTDVQAILRNYAHKGLIEFEDTGVVLLEFENNVVADIHYTVNSYQQNMEGALTIFAEKGSVKIGGQYLNKLEYQCIEGYAVKNLPEGNQVNNYGMYQGSMSNHDKVYDNLIDALKNNAAFSISPLEALKTVEIIEKIYQSVISRT